MSKLIATTVALTFLSTLAAAPAIASPAPVCSVERFSATPAAASLGDGTNPCIACYPSPGTGNTYATGSSCSVAESNLTSLLQSIAAAQCTDFGVCKFKVVITVACRQITPGAYRVDGHATHGCSEWICG